MKLLSLILSLIFVISISNYNFVSAEKINLLNLAPIAFFKYVQLIARFTITIAIISVFNFKSSCASTQFQVVSPANGTSITIPNTIPILINDVELPGTQTNITARLACGTVFEDLWIVTSVPRNYTYSSLEYGPCSLKANNILRLPLTFELLPSSIYNFINFNGGTTTVIDNPNKTGLDTTSKVAKLIKNTSTSYSSLTLSNPIDFSIKKIIRMLVLVQASSSVQVQLIFQNLEGSSTYSSPVFTYTATANTWQELIFDLTSIVSSNNYQTIQFRFNDNIPSSVNINYYFDNVNQSEEVKLPLTFELLPSSVYNFIDINGGTTTVIDNPNKTGLDTTSKVASFFKPANAKFAQISLILTNPFDFSTKKTIKMLFWSPNVGTRVNLFVFRLTSTNGPSSGDVLTTVANQWEDLTFDFSSTSISTTAPFQKFLFNIDYNIILANPTTFYFDNIRQD